MKKAFLSTLLFVLITMSAENIYSQNTPDATTIVRKADDKMRGLTSYGVMTMTVVRPTWSRTVSMKSWSKGRDYSLLLITAPAKEKGQVFLKLKSDMWNWVPSISRMIKIPPSMMMQSWMGSDFTNDDLLKESSIVVDYEHQLLGFETMNGLDCYKIQLTPKPEAAVVWGKILAWIDKATYNEVKVEYYDENSELVNVETLSEVKRMGDRDIPTHLEIVPVDKEGHKTILDINDSVFDKRIDDSFFSQQNMKRVK